MSLSLHSHPRVGPEESFLDWGRNSDFEEVTTRIGARHSGSEERFRDRLRELRRFQRDAVESAACDPRTGLEESFPDWGPP
ncbi:hypothetical protein GW17_00027207 [Ensete ventricosum]|nr:hypothetical protein GW17_00027207 [Ensete ventricosum]